MKTINAVLLSIGVAAAMASCGQENTNPVGNWTSAAPESVTESVSGATAATRTMTIDFNQPQGDADGILTLTADYDVTAPAVADSVAVPKSYKATATVNGKWSQDADDKDDYLLSFDTNTLNVQGVDAPELGPVTDAFLNSLSNFTTIEDVEVSKDGTHMTFETKNPDVKYHFVKK